MESTEGTTVVASADLSINEDIRRYLVKSLCEALHLEPDALGPQSSFRDLGLDSVSGVEFIHGVNREFGLHLDASIVYDHVHLDSLNAHVTGLVKKNRVTASGNLSPTVPITPPESQPNAPSSDTEPDEVQLRITGERTVSSPSERVPASISVALQQPHAAIPEEVDIRSRPTQAIASPRDDSTEIAIIGMSCRLPGAPDLDTFWRNLAAGVDSITEVPSERWDIRRFFDPDPKAEGKTYCKWAGFIDDVDKFDPLFFNLTHAEAR